MLFPIRGVDRAQGFLVVDHDANVDSERCLYITKFASMNLEMSNLCFRLKDEIRERKLVEELLRKERNKVQSYLDVAEVMPIGLTRDCKVDLINRKGCQILGYPAEEVVGKNWFDNFVEKDEKAKSVSLFNQIMDDPVEGGVFSQSKILNSCGELRSIEWNNTRVFNEEGLVVGTISCGTDVTELR